MKERKELGMRKEELSNKAVEWLKAHGYYEKARNFTETEDTLEFYVKTYEGMEYHNIRYSLGWSCMAMPRGRRA